MSEFDKEEERRKLREKFERDEERRQTTQEMSELLLKGATMLNVHCADCSSPIFRHEGEEFCPTCGRSVDELQTAGAADTDGEIPDTQPGQPEAPQDSTPSEQPAAGQSPAAEQPLRVQAPETNAGEALEAVIARLADRAATADDARQAKEYLEAAHQAARTYAILEGRPVPDRQSGS